jgi:HAD superfamily hydrolase (TIGR01548 family)
MEPAPLVRTVRAYHVPRAGAPIDLPLDGNEGVAPPAAVLAAFAAEGPEALRRYPDARVLEAVLAARLGVAPAQVVATAGGDDALERACRAVLAPGRELVLPLPTFEMLDRFGRMAGADVVPVPWPGPRYPTEAVIAAVTPRTAAIAVVSPNNPTGAVATAADLARLSAAAPRALLLVDLAYVEFADEDLTAAALALPNAAVFRTLSKAWGLAGLRVGYAAGPEPFIGWLRAVGLPYAVSRPATQMAAARLADGDEAIRPFLEDVRRERAALSATLAACGAAPAPSQANFVFARHPAPDWIRDALAGLGIGVRIFPGKEHLDDALRISCPGEPAALARVEHALRTALRPQALLFDADGVLVDVSTSYREAIVQTAAHFGVRLTTAEVAAAKAQPGSNNDWVLTRRLLAERGVDVPLGAVTAHFEALYQGADGRPGLRERESLLCERALLERLARRLPLGVVTGRPRTDAERFLQVHGVADCFRAVVCMEDAALKPDPAPVRLALVRLGVERAWLVGDSPDDVRAARGAGVVPLGVVAPGDGHDGAAERLVRAGAGRVLGSLGELEGLVAAVLGV